MGLESAEVLIVGGGEAGLLTSTGFRLSLADVLGPGDWLGAGELRFPSRRPTQEPSLFFVGHTSRRLARFLSRTTARRVR